MVAYLTAGCSVKTLAGPIAVGEIVRYPAHSNELQWATPLQESQSEPTGPSPRPSTLPGARRYTCTSRYIEVDGCKPPTAIRWREKAGVLLAAVCEVTWFHIVGQNFSPPCLTASGQLSRSTSSQRRLNRGFRSLASAMCRWTGLRKPLKDISGRRCLVASW